VELTSVSTTDSQSLTVDYDVSNNTTDTSFPIDVYRSSSDQPNEGDQVAVAQLMIKGNDAADGNHQIMVGPKGSGGTYTFAQPQALRPDPTYAYLLATADEDGSLDPDDVDDPSSASFHIYLLGAVSHGYIFSVGNLLFGLAPPDQTVPVTTQINVSPAMLTVTADNMTIVAGGALSTFTAQYTGFVRGDGPGVLSFSVPPGAGSQAGQFPITPAGLSSKNYAIGYVSGTEAHLCGV
jgi:hypothetical protein